MNDELEMGAGFYGFGHWHAPFWFIGPEPGGNNKQIGDDHRLRAQVWKEFGQPELCDCKTYHDKLVEAMRSDQIDEERVKKVARFFREQPQLPALQPTWRRLMIFLMAFKSSSLDKDDLRLYQRDHWGRTDDETCVIELTGLSFKNAKDSAHFSDRGESVNAKIDLRECKRLRAQNIHQRIYEGEHTPELVVMYGYDHLEFWNEVSGLYLLRELRKKQGRLPEGPEMYKCDWNPEKGGSTVFVFAPHPNARRFTDANWVKMGERAGKKAQQSRAPFPEGY